MPAQSLVRYGHTNILVLLLVALVGIAGVLMVLMGLTRGGGKKGVETEDVQKTADNQSAEAIPENNQGRGTNGTTLRNRNTGSGIVPQPEQDSDEEGSDGPAESEDSDDERLAGMTKKMKQKYRKKQRKLERNRLREEEVGSRMHKTSERDLKYQAKLAARQADKDEEQERLRELEAERNKQEDANMAKWEDEFETESEDDGNDTSRPPESQFLLKEFVSFIRSKKVVVLENIAARFGLSGEEVISRVTALQSMGRLTGVIDDRGKFVFVTKAEMGKVSDYINAKGRVSVSDLSRASHTLIDLVSHTTDIERQEQAAAEAASSESS